MNFSLGCRNVTSLVTRPGSLRQKFPQHLIHVLALFAVSFGVVASVHAQTAAYNGGITSTVNSSFSIPMGVTTDSSGNLFVADNVAGTANAAVYKLLRTGPGTYGSPTPLPGPASGYLCPSSITEPDPCLRGLAFDSSGNLWVADYGDAPGTPGQVYEMVNNSGILAAPVPVGTGWVSPWGVAADKSGNIFVTDGNTDSSISANTITEISPSGPTFTVTVINTGGVTQPRGIAVNSSDILYVLDGSAGHVMEVDPPYTSASILNGSFQGPGDIAIDASGNLWVSEFSRNLIRELTAGSGYATILAWGNGLSGPVSVWPDSDGTILLSDSGNSAVKQITLQPGANFGTKAIGSTSAAQTLTFTFTGASNTTVEAPIVVTQGATGKDFADAGTGTCTVTNGVGNPYVAGTSCTVSVTFTPGAPGLRMGAVELFDTSNNLLAEALLYGIGTGPQLTFSTAGQASTKLATLVAPGIPQKVAVDASGNIFVADSYVSKIFKIPAGGGTPVQVASGFSGTPYGFTVDGAGNLFIGDTDHYRIVEVLAPAYSTINNVSPVLSGPPVGLAVDDNDDIFVAEASGGGVAAVQEVTAASSYSSVKTLSTSFTNPFGIVVDASGNVFVADKGANSITELVGGSSSSTHSYGSFTSPEDVAVDAAGDLYVADNGGGTITELTIGTGYASSMILASGLSSPAGVAIDGKGNVYYSTDGSDNSIYEIDRADAPSLTFLSSAYQTLSTDSPKTVNVSNTGTASSNLNLSGLAITTTTSSAPNSFSLASGVSDCSATSTLTSGNSDESCNLNISFTPGGAVVGIAGKVTITDNATGSPQVINLNGTGTKSTPTITWATPSPISYGTTLAGVLNATVKNGTNNNTVAGTYAYTEQVGAGSPSTVTSSTILPVGTYTLTLHFTPTDTTDLNTPSAVGVSLTVTKATPTITWPTASGITYGQTLASSTLTGGSALNGSTTVAGSFAFTTPTTAPTAGTDSESVTFTPTDTTDYSPVTGSVNVVVSKATPTITWPTASGITYGQTLASSTLTGGSALNGSTAVTGTFAFATPATVPTAGTDSESVTFTPTDTTDYSPVTGSVNVVVSKATPTITWPTASAINYSQTLASSTLTGGTAKNGTTTVAGNFAFTTPTTTPPVGTNAQSVTFTPTDATDYNPVTGTVNVTVNKATATITWPTASGITYGQTLASSTLTGGSALNGSTTVAGAFAFTTPTTLPTAGTDSESVTFTPTDTTDYSPVTGTVNVVVSKATPTITWPAASGITYGQTLASSTLTGGSALNASTAVTGAFAFTTPATVPAAGTDAESVTFTPTDTTDYNPVTGSVNVVVSKTTPTITWPTASTIVYGQTLASSTLTGGNALNGATNVAGTFAFTTPTTAPPVGTSAESVTFTPTDTADYVPVTGTVNVAVIKASLTITWPTASTITYGQTLASSTLTGGSALNGTTVVPGTFSFTTPALAPTAGTHAESVTFTPTDTTNNPTVAGVTNVTVNKATPAVTWPTASGITYGQTLASSTLTGGSALSGATAVTGAFTFTTPSTVPTAGADAESVTFTPTDTTDYNSVTGSVNVAVGKATPAVTWPTASSIVYGETLSSSVLAGGSALNGATSVAGTFAFTVPTTVPPAGNSTQSVTFTPTDTADYVSVTGSVSVNVIKGNMTLTWPTASAITYGQTLASSTLIGGGAMNGTTVVSGSFAFTTPMVAPPAGIQTESVTFTPTDTTNYSVVTGTVNVTVNKAAPTITWPAASVIVHGQTLASSTLSGGSAVSGATSVAGTFAFATPTTVPADGNVAESVIFTPTDSTDYASVTGSVNVTVLDLTITATPAAQTGTAGGTFTYTIALAPSATGTPYPGPVSFAVIGGPAGAQITFSPTSVAANAGPQTVTMSVATSATSAALHSNSTGRPFVPVALAFLLLPLAGTKRMRRNGQRLTRFVCLLLLALAGVVATTALSGCGSNSGGTTKTDNGTQYTITVTAASGSVNPTTTVTLTLQ